MGSVLAFARRNAEIVAAPKPVIEPQVVKFKRAENVVDRESADLANLRLREIATLRDLREAAGVGFWNETSTRVVLDHLVWKLEAHGARLARQGDGGRAELRVAAADFGVPADAMTPALLDEVLIRRTRHASIGLGNKLFLTVEERAALGILTIRPATPQAFARAAMADRKHV